MTVMAGDFRYNNFIHIFRLKRISCLLRVVYSTVYVVNNGLLILADYLLCQHFIITLLALIDTKHSKGRTI